MHKRIADILYKNPFVLFLLVLGLAYLPVFLPFFHLKNDVLTQNLPTRYVFGESLYAGFSPFWNPFLNYGTPQYGDMNNGFWNPVQWLIGSTFGYTIYTITWEEMFYIFIGSWGIYKVSREFFDKKIALLTGIAYMCCGIITGHMQYFCWITGAGYFPYVLFSFIKLHKTQTIKDLIICGFCIFLFVSSTHPGLIIGALYLFIFILAFIYLHRKGLSAKIYHVKFWQTNALLLLVSCLLSLVVIVSNIDVLRHITRGSKVSLEQALWAPTTLQSYLSLLFPLAVNKTNFFATDIAMRNVYIGIPSLAGFVFMAIRIRKKMLLSIAIPLLFFILLAAGGWFKTISWQLLPLLGYVRLNGEFTYFVILILLFAGAYGLQLCITENKHSLLQKIFKVLLIISALAFITAVIFILISKAPDTTIPTAKNNTWKATIKGFFMNVRFSDLLLLQSLIQIATLYFLRKRLQNPITTFITTIANLIIITWLTLPFTGLGILSKKEIQSVINIFPRGTQAQPLVSIKNASYINPADPSHYLLIASYSKKIGSPIPDQYPVQINTSLDFATDTTLYNFITDQAFLFLSTDTTIYTNTNYDSTNIKIIKSGAGYTKSIVYNSGFKWLTFLQNDYPYWKVKINGVETAHFKTFKTFISVPINEGTQIVEFIFTPSPIRKALYINMCLSAMAIFLLLIPRISKRKIFK